MSKLTGKAEQISKRLLKEARDTFPGIKQDELYPYAFGRLCTEYAHEIGVLEKEIAALKKVIRPEAD